MVAHITPTKTKSIAVIGAGITGVTTAYALAKRGFDVTLFDRQPYAAMETSFANGGQLSASNAAVWNQLGTVIKGMRWVMKKDAPLLVHPGPSWHKYSWMAEFLRAIPRYEANTIETTRLAIAAREHLLEWAGEESIDFDKEDRGILHIFESEKELKSAQKVTDLLAKGGLVREPVTAAEIAALEPTLRDDYVGGFFTPSDFTGDVHKYSMGLADACKRRGVKMKFGTAIDKVRQHREGGIFIKHGPLLGEEREFSKFDNVVICAGVGSRHLAAQLGDRVNVYPVKGYSITVMLDDKASQEAAPRVSLLDEEAKIVTSRLGDNRFRVAGTAEFAGEDRDIRSGRIVPLTNWVRKNFPGVSTEHVVPWAGLRPMMPNMMPRVGKGKAPGVFYNTGHGHLGWTLSAATADMIAATVEADFMSNAA
ncbi:D-amino acid dehydrogenase [Ahrensia sp. R2A130]|uniref:D-amino acid dehydrogenase n=1 Tax=Ahrensia sp. R2A130 TaxID=744979 RepID=UPI0001E0C9B3|nr:D-amino acid dehydrogenase [Ahrensia sp. R2A130]EFL90820.1 D-amino acid dehydrogenase 3 small subunit [Ahrensia sp. R2A130]